MRPILTLIIAGSTLAFASAALAVPTAYYNPANGSIFLSNDTGATLALVNFKSPGGLLGGESLSIPGTTQDPGDKPFYLVYFNVPPTTSDPSSWHKIGPVVKGTYPRQRFDVRFTYFMSFAPGQTEQPGLMIHPEPTTMAMIACGAIGISSIRRQCRQ